MMLILLVLLAVPAQAWTLLGPGGRPTGIEVDASAVLVEEEPAWTAPQVLTDPGDLGRMATAVLRRLERWGEHPALGPALAGEAGVTRADVEATLRLVSETAAADADAEHPRLRDPTWLRDSFRFLRWRGDSAAASRRGIALEDGEIRLTRYLVWSLEGRASAEGEFACALYAVPDDEAHLDEGSAARASDLLRHRYTRSQVLDGVFAAGGEAEGRATPLVWLTRRGVHEALMQGTAEVRLPDGTTRTFNVHRSNGIPWDPGIADPERQDRFWYFREVDGPLGWGPGTGGKVPVVDMVSVAGDVHNLGFGKLLLLRGPGDVLRLAVLADTGGAFQPNLFQLDLFTGTHPSRAAFQRATASVPPRVYATLLVARRP